MYPSPYRRRTRNRGNHRHRHLTAWQQQQRSKLDERSRTGYRSSAGYRLRLLAEEHRENYRDTEAARRSRYSRVFHSPVLDVRWICLGATFEAELAALDDAAVLAQARPDSQRHFRRVAYLKHEIRSARVGGTSRPTSAAERRGRGMLETSREPMLKFS